MKIIREIATKKVFYLLNDAEPISLEQNFSTIGNNKVLDITSTTHEVVENVESPDLFVGGGVLSYDTSWTIVNQDAVTNAITKLANEFIEEVDKEVDSIIKMVVGEKAIEYLRAESEALAFQAANFTGDVPDSVNADVVAKGITPQAAALSIIAAANEWRTIQSAIRLNRLTAKANALAATTNAQLNEVKNTWRQFIMNIKEQLGITSPQPF